VKKTGKLLTLEEFAIQHCKEHPDDVFVYCDIECLAQAIEVELDPRGIGDWYLLDECGNYIWIDTEKFEIVRGDKSD
jgi:hypothetical protein